MTLRKKKRFGWQLLKSYKKKTIFNFWPQNGHNFKSRCKGLQQTQHLERTTELMRRRQNIEPEKLKSFTQK